jgi:hypothetical protein
VAEASELPLPDVDEADLVDVDAAVDLIEADAAVKLVALTVIANPP